MRVDTDDAVDTTTMPSPTAVVAVPHTALPNIQAMRENMAMDKARRDLLAEYVRTYMDAKRHAYDPSALGMGGDGKLRLNQDGARNLRGLYGVRGGEPLVEESWEGLHLDVRVKVPLISMNTGETLYWGIGFCSTRESKYAFRWMGDKFLPPDYDKRTGKWRQSSRGNWREYQVPNEHLADQYHTVRQMAKKRAYHDATMELPGVTELFVPESEADEETVAHRAALLKAMKQFAGAIASKDRDAVLRKLFGLSVADIPAQDTATLERYVQTCEEFRAAGLNLRSPTLLDDLRALIGERGQQAASELFGAEPEPTP